ncbi:uncharacterized protein [Dermacentor albipictus]|uniref:uncharacterized protein isoform X2 n=1 Tax=Dermacentor albipictus TaxID=60249 RepID=UPI0038FC2791
MPSESEKGGDQYAVVKFPEEGNSVALVHTKWLHGDVCLWPQDSKNVSYLAKCGASPSSNWQVVPCVPIDTFRTYDAARQKLKQAEDGSDLGSEVDLGRGKRKKQRRALSSSPESVQRLPLPPPSMMKKAQKRDGRRIHKQSSHASTSRANDPNVCSDQGAVQCAQMCASETSESEGEAESGGEQDAMQESSGIKRSFTAHSLMKKQAKWEIHSATMRSGIQVSLLHLFQMMVRELAALGGRNVSLSTRRILEALMTQEVAVQYSWLAQKGKKFLSLTTCDLIYKLLE